MPLGMQTPDNLREIASELTEISERLYRLASEAAGAADLVGEISAAVMAVDDAATSADVYAEELEQEQAENEGDA